MKNKFFALFLAPCIFLFAVSLCPIITTAQDTTTPLKATTSVSNDFSPSSYKLISPIGNISEVKDQDAGGLSGFFNLLIKIAIAIAGAIAVVVIIVNGIQYMASGNPWEKGENKMNMWTAIGGIALLLCSYIILYTINPDLVNIKIGIKKGAEGTWAEAQATEDDALVDNDTAHSTGQRLCNSAAECKTVCSTYCKDGKCDYTKPVPGIMDPTNAKNISGIKNISASAGVTVSPSVIEGLTKLSAVFATENAGYSANIVSGYRPINRQLELACANPGKVPSAIAYPGGSNHGTGAAVDIYLSQNGKSLSYCTIANSRKMDEMMTKAGWKRYNGEAWHYEYGVAASDTRCTFPNCNQAKLCGSK